MKKETSQSLNCTKERIQSSICRSHVAGAACQGFWYRVMETWLPSTERAEGLKTLSLHMCVMVPCVWEQLKNWWFCLNGVAWINTWCSPVTAESRSVAACTGRTASHIALFIISFGKIYFHSVPVWHLYCQHLFPLLTCSMTLVFVCTWVCFKSSMIRSEGGPGCRLDLTSGSQGTGGWPLYSMSSLCVVGSMATLGD